MTKTQIKKLEALLDERFKIAKHIDARMNNEDGEEFLPNNPDFIYYQGIIEAVEVLGLNWERKDGKHYIYN